MRRIAIIAALALTIAGMFCVGQQDRARAGCIIGGGILCSTAVVPSYQGPGDVVASATAWGSCARAYNAAYANGTNSLCDLVAVTGGAVVCTLRVLSTGFVDLAASYCAGTTPSAACAAASGGSCKVTKVYDQTGNGNHWTNVTLAAMPALTFSALGGLPGMTTTAANNTVLTSGSTVTQAQPFTFSGVFERTGSFTAFSAFMGVNGTDVELGFNNSANTAWMQSPTPQTAAATDSAFHSMQGVFNGASSNLVIDGSATATSAGATGIANTLRLLRGNACCTPDGVLMEGGIWPVGFNATQYGNMNSNQHGTNGYNF